MNTINIEELKRKSTEGDIGAMNQLAHCYIMGMGVEVDYKIAFIYLNQAANLGDPFAMANLAIYYSQGICVEKNVKQALYLFHNAACQGVNIRECIFQYIDKEELYRLATKGYPQAEYYYALTLGDDEKIKRDSLIFSASNKQLALAVATLALKTYITNPVSSNSEAKRLFQRAVDQGYDYFQMLNQIALMEQKTGIEKNLDICTAVRNFIGEKYERPFILVKITGKEWAEKLVNDGEIFFRSLGKFREINKPGVGDIYEGVANTNNALPFWNEIEKEAISEMVEVGMYDECMAHEMIYCLYALEYSEDGRFVYPNVRMRQFGDSAVVIWDGHEFCRRLEIELKKKYGDLIWFGHQRVNYNVIFSESQRYTEFSKTEAFAWQNEYRFIIDMANGRIENKVWDNMTDFAKLMYLNTGGKMDFFDDLGSELISIGNISDISTMYPIDDLINLSDEIIKKGNPYLIDNLSELANHCTPFANRPFIKL